MPGNFIRSSLLAELRSTMFADDMLSILSDFMLDEDELCASARPADSMRASTQASRRMMCLLRCMQPPLLLLIMVLPMRRFRADGSCRPHGRSPACRRRCDC